MRSITSLAACLCLAGSLSAQNEVMYSGTVSFTSRGNIGTGTGEVLQGFDSTHWRSLGAANLAGATGKITAMRGNAIQDQDQTTPETFQWVIRSGDETTGPVTGTAGELFVSGNQTLGPGTGTGPVAWIVTTALTTPIDVPSEKFFAVGVRLPASPLWSTDGPSVWATSQATDLSSTKQTDSAWQIIGTAATATHPSAFRTWRMGFNQAPAALQLGLFVGSGTVSYAQGGNFPIPGTDGLAMRVLGAGLDGQVAVVFLSGKFAPALPIFGGKWALDLGTLVSTPFVVGTIATGTLVSQPVPLIPATITGDFAFQAALFDLTTFAGSLTNAVNLTL